MYLRKSSQRSGTGRRYYLAIAHNVWISPTVVTSAPRPAAELGGAAAVQLPKESGRARPVRLVHLGEASQLDWNKAKLLVEVLREVIPPADRAQLVPWVRATALRLRQIHPLLLTLIHSSGPALCPGDLGLTRAWFRAQLVAALSRPLAE